jgi:hypothetical protein
MLEVLGGFNLKRNENAYGNNLPDKKIKLPLCICKWSD